MFSKLPTVLISSFFLFLIVIFAISIPIAHASTANHIVISEIKNNGSDEFIELYNPTNSNINLSQWHITKTTTDGTSETNFIAAGLIGTIPAHGFYLIANSASSAAPIADITYSTGFSTDSTITLYSDNKITVIDRVGIGSATVKELSDAPNPTISESIERKATSASTTQTMAIGGIDEFQGNGEDTDNNTNDFVLRSIPQPQNSSSSLEPVPTQTPTSTTTITPTVTETPSVTITSTPSQTPTTTPTDTTTPTPTATPTESIPPTESITPTSTPTTTPSTTPTDTPTLTPTISQSPTPTLSTTPTPTGTFPFITIPKFRTVCATKTTSFTIFSIHFHIPMITCNLIVL